MNEPTGTSFVEMVHREAVDYRVNILLIQSYNGVVSSYSIKPAEQYGSMQ
jgi:hypothetical protein